MTVSSLLGNSEVFELAATLRRTVREFRDQERALQQGLKSQSAAEAGRFEAATKRELRNASRTLPLLVRTSRTLSSALSSVSSKDRQRLPRRIGRLASKLWPLSDQREGGEKYHIQRRALDAERQRESEMTAATRKLEAFLTELGQCEDGLRVWRPARARR